MGGHNIFACTSIIVSGKVTPDGRPFILKNRDTGDLNNRVVMVQGIKYKFIGIAAASDTTAANIWSGHNETGFAIANTAAYNLVAPSPDWNPDKDEREGEIMREALEKCATLHDFEMLLDDIRQRLGHIPSNANFAVMDAQGGVAYYEVGNMTYTKFDANDPQIAPDGYIVRTNHGMTGNRNRDQGVERYMAMSEFAAHACEIGNLNVENIIRNATRYLTHGLTHANLFDLMPENDATAVYYPFRDFIPRYITSSAQVIQGVKAGENPLLTVAWTIAGSPLTTVAVPLMFTPNNKLPHVVMGSATIDGKAPLVEAGLQLKKQLFSHERGNKADYIDVAKLINKQHTGILQQIVGIEDEVFKRSVPVIEKVRSKGKAGKEMEDFYEWFDTFVTSSYKQKFNGVDISQ